MSQGPLPVAGFMDRLNGLLQQQGVASLEWLVLTNGDSDPFDSVILFGFAPGARQPEMVAKVPRMPQNALPLEVEFRSLKQLWSLLGSKADACLPRPVALVHIDGQPALVITHISGESLARASGRPFWSQEGRAIRLASEAACALRRLHDGASLPLAGDERPGTSLERQAEVFSRLFTLASVEKAALAALLQVAQYESRRARRKVLVQGDFWHGNLIRRPAASPERQLVFVDWQFAHWAVDVSTDVFLFPLAAALTGASYGTGPERARAAAALLLKWRTSLIPAYLSSYGTPSEYVLLPLREGILAACLEKAVRPALDFGYSHPDDLMWRLLFSELVNWPEENWILPDMQGAPA